MTFQPQGRHEDQKHKDSSDLFNNNSLYYSGRRVRAIIQQRRNDPSQLTVLISYCTDASALVRRGYTVRGMRLFVVLTVCKG